MSRAPRERPGVSVRGDAAAAQAHVGGRDEVRIRHELVPSALTDGTAFYPVVSAWLGTGRFLAAERIQERRLNDEASAAILVCLFLKKALKLHLSDPVPGETAYTLEEAGRTIMKSGTRDPWLIAFAWARFILTDLYCEGLVPLESA